MDNSGKDISDQKKSGKQETASSESSKSGSLKTAAVAIGEFAGKVTVMAESILPHAHHEAKSAAESGPVAPKKAKLAPKNKRRLPRRQKKAISAPVKARQA